MSSNTIVAARDKAKKHQASSMTTLKRLWAHSGARIGIILFAVLVFMAVFAGVLSPYDPIKLDMANANAPISLSHLLGTDELGRDELTRIMYGARYSLAIGTLSTLMALVFGVITGAISGYFGGMVDNLIMRFFDVLQAIPNLLLSIIVAIVLGSNWFNLMIALSVGHIAGYARTLRAQILSIRNLEYVEAAKATNCGLWEILFKYIVPNSFAPLIVQATSSVPGTILAAASLAFIGLGIQAPTPEWGAMLSSGKDFIRMDPKLVIIPGIFIIITVLSLNSIGDGLRDALDPKLKK